MLGVTPSEALLGYRPTLHPDQNVPSNNQTAEQRMETLHQKRAQAIAVINKVANQGPTPEGQFKEGDQVWLEATNLKLPYHTPKLAPRCQGPFHINKVISPVAYQLALPLAWGIHDVFHSSLLLPYKETTTHGPNFTRPPPDLIEGEEEYEVEAVINHRYHGRRRQLQYLIKWKDYPSSDNTWEAAEDVHTDDLVKGYHQRHPLESPKSKASQGTRKLARTLQLFTAPSPTQKVASWLLRSITPLIAHLPNHPLTLRLSKVKPSAFTAPQSPTFTAPNANTPSSTLASVTTPIANTTPVHKLWVNCQVNHPLPEPSKMTSSPPLSRAITQVESNMPPPSLWWPGRHTLSKVVPTVTGTRDRLACMPVDWGKLWELALISWILSYLVLSV